jgi:hypothetical protein
MKLKTYLATISLLGALTALPLQVGAQEDRSNLTPRELALVVDEFGQPASISYCYRGSIVDPTTGEILDLYGICDNSLGEYFDLA